MKTWLFFLLCLPAISIKGQNFNGSVYSGINLSRTSESHWGFTKPGFLIGCGTEWSFKRASLELQIQFSQKGFIFQDTMVKYDVRLNYIEMPLVISYVFKNHVEISLGGSFGKLVSFKEDTFAFYKSKTPFSTEDFSLILGLGYFFSPHFKLNLFLTQSANDLTVDADRNSLFNLRLTYYLYKNPRFYEEVE